MVHHILKLKERYVITDLKIAPRFKSSFPGDYMNILRHITDISGRYHQKRKYFGFLTWKIVQHIKNELVILKVVYLILLSKKSINIWNWMYGTKNKRKVVQLLFRSFSRPHSQKMLLRSGFYASYPELN